MNATANTSSTQHSGFAKVALPVPLTTHFTYKIPSDMENKVFVGCRVEVPFGRRVLSGIVVELSDTTDVAKVKPIKSIYETYLPDNLLELARWIASYYGCSLGEAAQSVLPPLLRRSRRKEKISGVIYLKASGGAIQAIRELQRAPKQLQLVETIARFGGAVGVATVTKEWGFTTDQIRNLLDKGIAGVKPARDESPLSSMEGSVQRLTEDQRRAFEHIQQAISDRRFTPMLLHGVTSSGKTELYLRAAQKAMSMGGGCIVLVPEIGLLPQATARYRRVFGDKIAILHSRLTGTERFDIWQRVESGEHRLVLGPRSAVFSPVKNLRLIIVDEEQDDSYKQGEKPRYHARSVALIRGKQEGATVVLGSATPSAESFHHAMSGRYVYLSLPNRIEGTVLPRIHFVDMRSAQMEGAFFSSHLLERLEYNLSQNHQSILFLNKRGHARFVQCSACGWVGKCENCDISLTYHRVNNRLRCHFCGYNTAAVKRCAECGSPKLYFSGAGTQRVELDLASFFPRVGILRMDADTTSGKDGHRKVLEKFSTGKYPILIGTQMVTKGHHFPRVNLVGVLFAEESLNFPDFRSSEKTFQQLIQAGGRAGRSSSSGEVVIQTYTPDHHVFRYLKEHDYNSFMKEELSVRDQLKYPPFSRLVLASCVASNQKTLTRVIERWTENVRRILSGKPVDVLGPVPPLVAKIKNRYREQLLIKGPLTSEDKQALLVSFKETAGDETGGKSVELRWDVDPESFF